MRKYVRYTTAALLAAGMVGLAIAQPRQGGGRGFGGGGPASLVTSKTVLADIKATEEQTTKLKEWAKEYQQKQFASFKDFQGLSKEEIQEKVAANTEKAWKDVGGILKEEQVKRLKQIEIQFAGSFAYSRKDVAEALKITDDQKDKLGEIGKASFQERSELNEEYGGKGFFPPKLDGDKKAEYDKKLAAITKDMDKKIEGVLTDDQKKKWKELTGEPIDVAKIRTETAGQFGGGGGFKKKKKDD